MMNATLIRDSKFGKVRFGKFHKRDTRDDHETVELLKRNEVGATVKPSRVSMDVFEFDEDHTRVGWESSAA